jgi:hypothetical protein
MLCGFMVCRADDDRHRQPGEDAPHATVTHTIRQPGAGFRTMAHLVPASGGGFRVAAEFMHGKTGEPIPIYGARVFDFAWDAAAQVARDYARIWFRGARILGREAVRAARAGRDDAAYVNATEAAHYGRIVLDSVDPE